MGPITSFYDIPRLVLRRIWVVLLVLAIGLPLSVFYALNQPRVYEATAVVQIEASQVAQRLTNQTGAGASTINPDSELDLIEQQLMARDSMVGLLDQFTLFEQETSLTVRVGLLRNAVEIFKLVDPANAWRPEVHPSGLAITVRLGDPDTAADVANALLERVLIEARDRTSGRTARTLDFLVSEEDRLTQAVSGLEFELSQFQQQNSGALPEAVAAQRTQLASLEETRIEIEDEIVALNASSDQLLADTLERRSSLLNQRLELVVAAIADIRAEIASAPEVQRQINAYVRRLEQLQNELSVITTSRAEAAMNQLLESRNQAERFEVLESAIPPEFPVSASRRKMAMVGGVLVGFLALTIVVALEVLEGTIRTPRQLERELGVAPVVAIPNLNPRRDVANKRVALLAVFAAGLGLGIAWVQGWLRAAAERLPQVSARDSDQPAE